MTFNRQGVRGMAARTKRTHALQAFGCRIKRLSQYGVTTVEYAVMLVLVALFVLTFGTRLGEPVKDTFSKLVLWLEDGSSGGGTATNSGNGNNGNNGRGGGNGNGNGNGRGSGNGNGDVNGRGLGN